MAKKSKAGSFDLEKLAIRAKNNVGRHGYETERDYLYHIIGRAFDQVDWATDSFYRGTVDLWIPKMMKDKAHYTQVVSDVCNELHLQLNKKTA